MDADEHSAMAFSTDQLLRSSALRQPSSAALEVIRCVGTADYDRAQLTWLVRRDPALAAGVLRAAQMPVRAPRSIDDAVAVLGEQKLKRVALHVALTSLRIEALDGCGIQDFGLWRSALACAHACEWLAHRVGLEPSVLYVAGLLLDVGKVVLSPHLSESQWGSDAAPDAVETAAVGIHHAEIGALLLESWDVPDPIVSCVRYHHTPAEAPTEGRSVACAHVGAWCTQWLGRPSGFDALRHPFDEVVGTALGIDEDDLRQLALAVVRGLNSDPERAL